MRIFKNLQIDWMKNRKIFFIISTVLFAAGMLSLIFKGLEFGIDFKGGTEIVLRFEQDIQISEVRNLISGTGLGEVEVKTYGDANSVLIRTELQDLPKEVVPKVIETLKNTISKGNDTIQVTMQEPSQNFVVVQFPTPETANMMYDYLNAEGFKNLKMSEEITNTQLRVRIGISEWIKETLQEKFKNNRFTVMREDRVGPKVGDELKSDAIIAVVLSLLGILIYLAFRFKLIFATGAVVALFHDVLITLGLYSILYSIMPFNLQIDLTVVAAFLTLVGYSINDTVIVFDRVREILKIHKNEPIEKLINMSINKTMSRTILTGGTTLLAVAVLFILGGEVLRPFAFTLFFGIIIGTYSSIFVASALVLEYAQRKKAKIEF
ncbi:Protein translocase subunit SecF [uncultured bacterium]|nr:Protein translocase subunit SecF [uncultured bacterium]